MARRPTTQTARVRVIGGKWSGRHLGFPSVVGLRPTPDRVREQLFNWLQGELNGARCLDLFAGSGALGFEAASRGAATVTLVDRHPAVIQHLSATLVTLSSDEADGQCSCVAADGLDFIRTSGDLWHLIFLDPPFDHPLNAEDLLVIDRRLESRAWVYHEQRTGSETVAVPPRWQPYRQGRAGDTSYVLYRIVPE